MFLVEGGMSFDTRNAVAGARAFQRELQNTGKVAQDVSKQGPNLEGSFSRLGDNRTRSAIKNLATSLANAKDATEATADAARALQIAFVKSLTGTAIISGAGALANVIRDVGAKISGAADESARAMNAFKGFATSLDEGRQRSDALTTSADNTLKALEGLKNAGIFQAGVFKLFGGENVLKDLEDATRGVARAEFGAGAQAERMTAERRVGMTPEQIEQDKRRQEEKKRLREAREKGGPRAEADVARTIAAENRQTELQKGAESAKKFDKDIADNADKLAEMRKSAEDKIKEARLDALVPAARITELDKEAVAVTEKIAQLQKDGIFGTEEARKKQLEEILRLEQRSLDIANQKTKALAEQKQEQAEAAQRAERDRSSKVDVEIEERKRQRESARKQSENRAELGRMAQQVKRNEFEEQLRKSFGAGAWSSIPENIKNQMLISGVSNQHLSMISKNTAQSGAGGSGQSGQFGFQPSGRYGRPASGFGMERPEGYVPAPAGVNVLFGTPGRRGKPSRVSPDNPYQRTRIRGERGQSIGPEGDLAAAIRELANKIPAAVPV